MNAMTDYDEACDLDVQVSFRHVECSMQKTKMSSKNQTTARARFGRHKGASSFNGAHRRRNKRNYL